MKNGAVDMSKQTVAYMKNRNIAQKSNPALWERLKKEVVAGSKGGEPGSWSARKAQLLTQLYKKRGGGFVGPKKSNLSLAKWTRQRWRTRSGKTSKETGERYLPEKAWKALSSGEKSTVTRLKRKAGGTGSYSKMPERIAQKIAKYRKQ